MSSLLFEPERLILICRSIYDLPLLSTTSYLSQEFHEISLSLVAIINNHPIEMHPLLTIGILSYQYLKDVWAYERWCKIKEIEHSQQGFGKAKWQKDFLLKYIQHTLPLYEWPVILASNVDLFQITHSTSDCYCTNNYPHESRRNRTSKGFSDIVTVYKVPYGRRRRTYLISYRLLEYWNGNAVNLMIFLSIIARTEWFHLNKFWCSKWRNFVKMTTLPFHWTAI